MDQPRHARPCEEVVDRRLRAVARPLVRRAPRRREEAPPVVVEDEHRLAIGERFVGVGKDAIERARAPAGKLERSRVLVEQCGAAPETLRRARPEPSPERRAGRPGEEHVLPVTRRKLAIDDADERPVAHRDRPRRREVGLPPQREQPRDLGLRLLDAVAPLVRRDAQHGLRAVRRRHPIQAVPLVHEQPHVRDVKVVARERRQRSAPEARASIACVRRFRGHGRIVRRVAQDGTSTGW